VRNVFVEVVKHVGRQGSETRAEVGGCGLGQRTNTCTHARSTRTRTHVVHGERLGDYWEKAKALWEENDRAGEEKGTNCTDIGSTVTHAKEYLDEHGVKDCYSEVDKSLAIKLIRVEMK